MVESVEIGLKLELASPRVKGYNFCSSNTQVFTCVLCVNNDT